MGDQAVHARRQLREDLTASISMCESPTDTRFVTASSCSLFCTWEQRYDAARSETPRCVRARRFRTLDVSHSKPGAGGGTCKKACIFHAWLSPGNEDSKAPLAEMISTWRSGGGGRNESMECEGRDGSTCLREIPLDARHAQRGGVLHPAFRSVRDDEHLAHLLRLHE